jgi:hypothetical protein
MRKQWLLNSVAVLGFIGASCSILSAQQPGRTAAPGTLNYFEGQVSIDGGVINRNQVGYAQLQPNQILSTGIGKAEVLLSPGVFVRVGNNSGIRLVSADMAAPQVEVVGGEAIVEVDLKLKDARIDVLERGADASIQKVGLYRFDAEGARVGVLDGKLTVSVNGQSKELGKGKEVNLTAPKLEAVSFDPKVEDDLYRWSSVRAGYLAEANAGTAQGYYAGYSGYGPFVGDGWYWNPYFGFYSWLPGDGFFYSPFGYPFFSPRYALFAPRFGFGYRGGYLARGGFSGRGVAMAPRGIGGGGFHGGGGGGGGRR